MSKKFQVIGTFHEPNSFHDPYEQRRTGIFSKEGKTVYFGGSGEQEYGVEREELILRDKSFTPEQKSNALKNYFKSPIGKYPESEFEKDTEENIAKKIKEMQSWIKRYKEYLTDEHRRELEDYIKEIQNKYVSRGDDRGE